MRIISANLNGIRSAATKGFFDWLPTLHADVVCVQELKAQAADLKPEFIQCAGPTGPFPRGVCRASPSATTPPVMAAVRVPPSA